jgi:DNA polymerase-3 subunit epsilon
MLPAPPKIKLLTLSFSNLGSEPFLRSRWNPRPEMLRWKNNLMVNDYVIFDLETTGLSPERDEIIQIAALRLSADTTEKPDAFLSYVNPGRSIPPFIAGYTGVTDAHVRHAPTVGKVLEAFSRYAGDATLIAHNGHRFDMKFLREACTRNSLPTRSVGYHDSIYLSRLVWGKLPERHGLDAVLSRLGISSHGARRHDARGDVTLLAEAVARMWSMLRSRAEQPVLTLYRGVLPTFLQADLPGQAAFP